MVCTELTSEACWEGAVMCTQRDYYDPVCARVRVRVWVGGGGRDFFKRKFFGPRALSLEGDESWLGSSP